ncbi:MAG: hypothetical protein ACI8T1_001539 [Verrucomicrobiales bacterium]|jgi:hypothetical protein
MTHSAHQVEVVDGVILQQLQMQTMKPQTYRMRDNFAVSSSEWDFGAALDRP